MDYYSFIFREICICRMGGNIMEITEIISKTFCEKAVNYGRPQRIYNDEVVGMFGNKRNGALLALTQTFQKCEAIYYTDSWQHNSRVVLEKWFFFFPLEFLNALRDDHLKQTRGLLPIKTTRSPFGTIPCYLVSSTVTYLRLLLAFLLLHENTCTQYFLN